MKSLYVSCALSALLLCGTEAALAAKPEMSVAAVKVDIQAKPMTQALAELAAQTGVQLMFSSEDVDKKLKAPAVSGMYTPQAALDVLLANSGLGYRVIDSLTIAIRPVKGGGASSVGGLADQMRLAVAEVADEKPASASDDLDADRNQVVVRDSKARPAPFSTANLDLTRTEDDALPFQVFDAKEIELSGAADIREFLQNRLPQNFNSTMFHEENRATDLFDTTANQIDFRGWGAKETVFLLNGRRMGAQYRAMSSDDANGTPNLQGIPLASIERIEILASAGSALYGANATGGVINIITRQDFRGGQLAVNYESPSESHAPRRSVSFNYGLPIGRGFGVRLSGAYIDSDPLRVGERTDVSIERWRQLVMERDPTRIIGRSSTNPANTLYPPPFGATPNIRSRSTSANANLFSAIGGVGNFTSVPAGYAGGGGVSVFQPQVWNLQVADGAAGTNLYASDSTFGAPNINVVAGLGVDKAWGDVWRWSIDYSYTENKSSGSVSGEKRFNTFIPATSVTSMVPALAPTNPFMQDVIVFLIDPRLQRSELERINNNVTYEIHSTLRGGIGEWRGFVDLSYTKNRNRNLFEEFREPIGGWRNAFLSGAYNPFVDTRVVAPATDEFYDNYIELVSLAGSAVRHYQTEVRASGPTIKLPAGPIELTVGAEWTRADRYESFVNNSYRNAVTQQLQAPVAGDAASIINSPDRHFTFDTYAVSAESVVPIFSSQQHVPLIKHLEANISGRLGRELRNGFRGDGRPVEYTSNPHVYALGMRYEILSGLMFRVSRSIGFRPPSMSQVTPADPPTRDACCSLRDPMRNNGTDPVTLTPTMYITGGNSDLQAETSNSTNVGLILQPSARGLRISVDYLETIRHNAIYPIGIQEMINLESEFPDRVQREAPDSDPSGLGRITFVDGRNINLNQIASKSVDFSVEQQFDEIADGRLVLTAAATKNLSFKVQTTPASAPEEQVRNVNGAFSQQIEWNANAQVLWGRGQWQVGWNTRYYDYVLARPGDYILQGSDRAPREFNHDVVVNFSVPKRGSQLAVLAGTSFTLSVKNVFDRTPRFWAASTERGIAPYDSILGRSISLQFIKSL